MKKTWDERYCDDNVECILTEFLICCSVAECARQLQQSDGRYYILYLNGGGHRRVSYIHYQCIHYYVLLKYKFYDVMRIEAKKQPNIIHLIVDSSLLFHLLQTTKLLYEERRCRNDGDGRVVAVGRIKL